MNLYLNLLEIPVSSMVLVKMKEIAETCVGKSVSIAIVTVPAYLNDL